MNLKKEITIYDLARKLDISPATVSRGLKDNPAININTRKKIKDLAEKMGYRANNFARSLREQRTYTIGVIVPRLNSYFMADAISGIENIANKEGYNLIISQSSESIQKEKTNAITMFNSRVDGLLVSSVENNKSIDHFDIFFNKKIPVIFFDRVMERNGCMNILIDNRKAAYQSTVHLLDQGCKNIVHITSEAKTSVYIDRLKGYREALAEYNIKQKEELIIKSNFINQEAGKIAAELIKKMRPLPDGVFAANDLCAVVCMATLKQAGFRIPEDIAFVGFNNDPVSTVVEPNLSTTNYRGYEMGEIAAQHLISHLNEVININLTDTIILISELVIRDSSRRKIKA